MIRNKTAKNERDDEHTNGRVYKTTWEAMTQLNRKKLFALRDVVKKLRWSEEQRSESMYVLEGYRVPLRHINQLVNEEQKETVGELLEMSIRVSVLVNTWQIGLEGTKAILTGLVNYHKGNRGHSLYPTEEQILIRSAEVRTGMHIEKLKVPHKMPGWDERTWKMRARGYTQGDGPMPVEHVEVTRPLARRGGRRVNRKEFRAD